MSNSVRTRRLGRHGPEISVVGYGAWQAGGDMWGDPSDDAELVDAMLAAIDAGMGWIDTAEAYGDGRSEEIVRKVLAARPGGVMVFTKVAPFATGTRPEQVKRAIRGSLGRLGVDRVDLYQVHWPAEEDVPVEETWGAMAELQDEGLARWIGVSNFERSLVERCLAIRHVDSVQNQLSLLHRQDERGLLPWLRERGIGYLAYGPLAFGLLAGTVTAATEFAESDWRSGRRWRLGYYEELFAPGKLEANLALVERLREVASDQGMSLPTLALRAAIDTPGVTAVIAGSKRASHVRDNAAAGEAGLDPETLDRIRRLLEG
jgi:aryl-alcohol dehydrogenase-like predicted oxidoreductase